MRKLLIVAVCIAGLALFVATRGENCPMHGDEGHSSHGDEGHSKSECPKCKVDAELIKEVNIEVTNIDNGTIIKVVSDKPELVKKIQEWAVNKFGHKKTTEEDKKVEKVKDLICGMEIEKDKALSAKYEGKTYYFCAQDCKDEFLKDPATYIGKTQEGR